MIHFFFALYTNDTLIKNLLSQFEEAPLVRVHRSFAVSVIHFDHIDGNTIFIGNKTIPMGQKYRQDFLQRINYKV